MQEIFQQSKEILPQALKVLNAESSEWRPADTEGRPGGLVYLDTALPTFMVPDLHGREDFLPALLKHKYGGESIGTLLREKKIQIVCVGDGMHAEVRAKSRWHKAMVEYTGNFEEHSVMDEEMAENLNTMTQVMKLKVENPRHFHFLKGNHENILNEDGNGNHPFLKFAAEGPMTKVYVERFLGSAFLAEYDRFEKSLPLLARGGKFIISHAQPKKVYKMKDIIHYRAHPEVVEGLTWTRDYMADAGAAEAMLRTEFGIGTGDGLWFVGHSPVKDLYQYLGSEPLIKFHNPSKRVVVRYDPAEEFDVKRDIFEI